MKYIILSTERRAPLGYFVAIHGFSPFFSFKEKARRFNTEAEAKAYADKELFTTPDAAFIEAVES